jgi:hypothetical protein
LLPSSSTFSSFRSRCHTPCAETSSKKVNGGSSLSHCV